MQDICTISYRALPANSGIMRNECLDSFANPYQILACDDIIEDIIDSHRSSPGSVDDEDLIGDEYELYGQVREFSVKSFENRFQTSAL